MSNFFTDIATIAKLLPTAIAELKKNTTENKDTQASCAAVVASNGATQESNNATQDSNKAVLASNTALAAKIDKLQATLDALGPPADTEAPPAPGAPTIQTVSQFVKEDGSMGFKYGIAPQPLDVNDPNDNDVVKRVVTATNTTKGTPTQTATITQPSVDVTGACYAPGLILADDAGADFVGDAGDSITLTDQVFDGAGNPSPVEQATATVIDTVAPPAPGAIGIQTVAQV